MKTKMSYVIVIEFMPKRSVMALRFSEEILMFMDGHYSDEDTRHVR